MRRGKTQVLAIFLIFALCVTVVAFVFISLMNKDREERNRYVSFYDYYTGISPDAFSIVMGDEILMLPTAPEYTDGLMYFPHDYITEYIDPYLFWEPWAGRLTVTNGAQVYKFNASSTEYTINMLSAASLDNPIIERDGIAYLPENLLISLYNLDIRYNPITPGPKLVIVRDNYDGRDTTLAHITVDTARLRYAPGPKEPICHNLTIGSEIQVFGEPVTSDGETYIKVRSLDGVTGYILEEEAGEYEVLEGRTRPVDDYKPFITEDSAITMAWYAFYSKEASTSAEGQQPAPGLDVVSPTWFSFDDTLMDGTIIDLADVEYSRWAHSQGFQVWGLITDNFNYDVSNAILTNTEIRERVVRSLIEYAAVYEMDGINIDFESVREEDIKYYLQFLRELYPLLRERGLVLSVDMYAPSPWNLYYNRTEIAKSCDFLIVMAYDEYWSTRGESGPNASIGFVENAITDTLGEVPREKLILAIPFYVRRWMETKDALGVTVATSKSESMDYTRSLFENNGTEFVWNEETASYYGEYTSTDNGAEVLNRVWLEDIRSIEEKLKLADKYGLAGVSAWRKGFENPGVWEIIDMYMK